MDVIETAAAIGLTTIEGDDLLGTIEEAVVVAALSDLAAAHPGLDDLFAQAVARAQRARSAGVDHIDPGSVFARRGPGSEIQLRYRADMLELFIDLAIDVGIESAQPATPLVG